MLLQIGLIEMQMDYFPRWTISKELNGLSSAALSLVDIKKLNETQCCQGSVYIKTTLIFPFYRTDGY